MLLNLPDPLRRTALRRYNQVEAAVWFLLIGNNVSNHGRDCRQRLAQALLITKNSALIARPKEMKKLADSSELPVLELGTTVIRLLNRLCFQ